MMQKEIINQLKEILVKDDYIKTAFLYGSFARQSTNVNSDIDIATIVNKDFNVDEITSKIQQFFSTRILRILRVNLRNKIVIYFKDLPKAEITIYQTIKEHDRNFLGSEIPFKKIPSCILFDKMNNALPHLEKITKAKEAAKNNDVKSVTLNLINKFIYEFESCSNAHRRSDGYHFYFFYNLALHVAIQLNQISKGQSQFNFLPKNFITRILNKNEQLDFYSLKGSLFLPEANKQKRGLLDFFYSTVRNLIAKEKFAEIELFCETIYKRDFLWNFRDISIYNPNIKRGLIYRTSTLTLIQNENFFESFIKEKKIETVIDLRAKREVLESNYSARSLEYFNWVYTPFNPWAQSIEFQATHHQGTDVEIAYRFFAIECKASIKKAIEAILCEKNSIAIHCYAGKDRTGVFISMLHLFSGANIETVYDDYLASEMDTKKEYLDIVLNIINSENGIENYFFSCGLTKKQLLDLNQKIVK